MSARRRRRDRRRKRAAPWPRPGRGQGPAQPADAAPEPPTGALDLQQRSAVVALGALPAARPEEVASPEAIVTAVYAAISGPAEREQPRDWDRFRTLFLPGARFLLTRWGDRRAGQQEDVLRQWDLERFIAVARMFYRESAFWEREIWHRTERFGNVAHVFSTYESRVGSPDSEPVGRGINSFQLVRTAGRWWIANVAWDVEVEGNPIPEEYR
ncbi:MAG TPA: hypothetical protein VIL18_07785 [Longimicrobiales bacterium]